jgi:hypothetical protein
MAIDADLWRAGEEAERRVSAMSREDCLAAAKVARDVKPILATDRQRQIAEALAVRFEERAAHASSAPSE